MKKVIESSIKMEVLAKTKLNFKNKEKAFKLYPLTNFNLSNQISILHSIFSTFYSEE